MKHSKIAIIGAGLVGSTTAYALLLQNITAEIILIDINEVRCLGELLDLSDALSLNGASRIRIGNASDAAQADIIIIAAGKPQKKDESRIELLNVNTTIIISIIEAIKPINKSSIILVIANPVDLITLLVQKISELPYNQVFGSGTFLDTQRLYTIMANKLHFSEKSINAYVLGEHGDSQFVAWSSVHIGGVPIIDFPGITNTDLETIADEVKNRAYEIISCKGATYYGIAACAAKICKAIIFDQKMIMPLSVYQQDFKICLSTPVVLGENGIERILPIQLNEKEQNKLAESAKQLNTLATQLKIKTGE